MPKKSARGNSRRSKRKSPKALLKRTYFIILGCLVVLSIGLFGNIFNSKPFCANSESCIKDLSGKFEKDASEGEFEGRKVTVPREVAMEYVSPLVLGENTAPKKIAVDLTNQHLYAYEGDRVVMDFPVSTGKWHYTPTGVFNIWVKLRYTRMSGGDSRLGTYYNLPNVPYTMFYYNSETPKSDGYSIHGAYWHNNFGHPMSHGCVNMKIADAGQLFAWADPQTSGWMSPATDTNPGTQVVVYGTTPQE